MLQDDDDNVHIYVHVHIYYEHVCHFQPPSGYIRGVDVTAETAFEITNQAHTYEWKGHGVKLHIRENSLPANCPVGRVQIKASLSGQYKFPADCDLVSGIYWMYCPAELTNAELEVQHCSVNKKGLVFVRADCTQKQLPYVFQCHDGGSFSEHSFQGSISLSKFSGWGIMRKILHKSDPKYMAQVCYAAAGLNKWKVLFAIRRGLDLENIVGGNMCA